MKKYKICIYAICKNEEKFIDRFYQSVKDADQIVVLDTGSTDNSVAKMKELGITVYQKEIKPWRFDDARNEALKLIDEDVDICISLDLDEVILPGWREQLEQIWEENTTRLKYVYNWQINKRGEAIISFYSEKIHSRKNYKWINAVHEVLKYQEDKEKIKITDNITINHYPDSKKSRSSYLPLLEIAVEEDPENDRNTHYLGREYMYYNKHNEAIDTLIKHLKLKSATWIDERAASMRFIARSYKRLNRIEEAKMWFDKAIKEAPHLRDALIEKALLEYEEENWKEVIKNCENALKIKSHQRTYINEPFSWNETPYDLLSIAYYYTTEYNKALENVDKALKINDKDERIINNKKLIEEKIIL